MVSTRVTCGHTTLQRCQSIIQKRDACLAQAIEDPRELVGRLAGKMPRGSFTLLSENVDAKDFTLGDQVMNGSIEVNTYKYKGRFQGERTERAYCRTMKLTQVLRSDNCNA